MQQLELPLEGQTDEIAPTPPVNFFDLIKVKDAELTSIDLSLDGLSPWSNSKYKSLKKCPFQFYLKYILKIKIPDHLQTQSDPLSANVGKAAHEILESILLGKNVDKAYLITKKNYVDKGLIALSDWEAKVEALRYNIDKFSERIEQFNRVNPVKRVLTELRLAVDRNFEPTGFFSDDVWLRGVIDLIMVLECSDAVIIDHKTGGGQGPVTPYKEQLDWYKVLFHFGMEKVRGVQTGIHFIGEGEVKMADYTPKEDIESKLKNTLVMSLEGAIEMLMQKGYFKHVRGAYCKWCEYDNIGCKSGELKPLELSTKKWIKIKAA
jgi:hypothetical protein